jgi:putative oxidoreductase
VRQREEFSAGIQFSDGKVKDMSDVVSRPALPIVGSILRAPEMLSVLRILTGLLFLEHGTGKLLGFPPGLPFIDQMPPTLLYFTGTMELIGGFLVTIGLFTRPAAFILSGFMAFGYFMVHFPQSFFPAKNYGEAAVLFCFVFLYLAAVGSGPWAVRRD